MEFKKISQLPMAEGLTESTNVLIEADGATKRIPAKQIAPDGMVKSVNGNVPDENGNVAIDIPDCKLPEISTPNQMLVTDADGVAKWEDRLTYTEDCEIIHRQTVSCELKEGSLYGSTVDGHLTDEIVGKSLKVVFDGVEYECEAVKFSGDDGVYLGNTSLIGAQGGNGEPFIIFGQGNCVIGVSEPGEYEICILESHIKTIDPKYLPTIVFKNKIGAAITCNVDFATFESRLSEGAAMVMVNDGDYGLETSSNLSAYYDSDNSYWVIHAEFNSETKYYNILFSANSLSVELK